MRSKSLKKRLLSLVMVVALLCSLAPAAMAAGYGSLVVGETTTVSASFPDNYASLPGVSAPDTFLSGVSWSSTGGVSVTSDPYDYTSKTATVTAVSAGPSTVTAVATYVSIWGLTEEKVESWSFNVAGSGTSESGYTTISNSTMSLDVGGSGSLSVFSSFVGSYPSVSWYSSNPYIVSVSGNGQLATITGNAPGTAVITAGVSYYLNGGYYTDEVSCFVTVGGGSSNGVLYISPETLTMNPYSTANLTAYTGDGMDLNGYVTWTSSAPNVVGIVDSSNRSTVTLQSYAYGQSTITATAVVAGQAYSASCVVTVGEGAKISAQATVAKSEYTFTLGSRNAKTAVSVADQIASSLSAFAGWNARLASVEFKNVTTTYGSLNAALGGKYTYSGYATGVAGDLSSVAFTPSQQYMGTATFNYTAYDTVGNAYSGVLTITVEPGFSNNIDILYALSTGASKALNISDFTSFWSNATSASGTLNYVTFGTATGNVGTLTYRNSYNYETAVTPSVQFFASAGYNQKYISDVTFTPNRTGNRYNTGTLVVPFTAYGTSSGYVGSTTSMTGNLYIVVTEGEVQTISYQSAASGVTLEPTDFVSVYRQATSSTATNPTMYIQFLDVPAYGDLYYGYKNNTTYNRGTRLTATNIGGMRFSSRSNSTYSIDDLTYFPSVGKIGDTIRYAAYSNATGGTLLYVGEITFGVTSAVSTIKYYSGNGSAVRFSSDDFYSSNNHLYSQYISFGAPSSGKLYKDYSDGKGTQVTATDLFSYTTNASGRVGKIDNITYVPASGYTGVVEIPYTATNLMSSGGSTGTIRIYVVSKSFKDVTANHWAHDYVTELVASGIVDGVTPTTFEPSSNVKYGEALKLIMLATGSSVQNKTSSHWASGYLTEAYRKGYVTSTNIDLNAAIDRNTIAEIAAKALKLNSASSVNAGITKPVDSNNGYVFALYNAGIVNGTTTGGRNYFNGSDNISRAEISAIICRINDYNK